MRKLTPSYAGMTFERLDKCGLQWPCPTEDHPGTKYLHKDKFSRGKGKFHAVEYSPPAEQPDREYPFVLTTGRVLFQYHTGTMTRRSAGLNECAPECVVEMNRLDAEKLGLANGEMVKVSSRRGTVNARAAVGETTDVGHLVYAVPLSRGRCEHPHHRRARSSGQNPGIQGLRGKARKGGLGRRCAPEWMLFSEKSFKVFSFGDR